MYDPLISIHEPKYLKDTEKKNFRQKLVKLISQFKKVFEKYGIELLVSTQTFIFIVLVFCETFCLTTMLVIPLISMANICLRVGLKKIIFDKVSDRYRENICAKVLFYSLLLMIFFVISYLIVEMNIALTENKDSFEMILLSRG